MIVSTISTAVLLATFVVCLLLSRANRKRDKKIDELTGQIKLDVQHSSTLRHQVWEVKKQLDDAREETRLVTTERNAIDAECGELNIKLAEAAKKVDELEAELSDARRIARTTRSDYEASVANFEQYRNETEEMRARFQSTRTHVAQLEKSLNEASERLIAVTEQNADDPSVPVSCWIVGQRDGGRYLGMTPNKFVRVGENDPTFPRPFADLGRVGKVWDSRRLDIWIDAQTEG